MSNVDATNLLRRNRNAFRRHYPQIWAELEQIGTPTSKAVMEDGIAVNIDLGDVRLYPEPAPVSSAKQLEAYFQNPDRIGFDSPIHCNLSSVSSGVLREIGLFLAEHAATGMSPYPVVDVGFGFIFGVGLGFHVADLVRRNLARNLVLIEPVPEFLLHSMQAVDWTRIFAEARKKGMILHFLIGRDPQRTVEDIETVIRRMGSTFLDGSYAYVHYPSWNLREGRSILNEKIKVYYLSSGFFEDELLMMRNTYANLRGRSFHLIDRRPRVGRPMPVFVVGSGPSLDKDLPYIKKWRDRVIVCSCGTSLGILLKNGIRPDLHVENENTEPLVKNLRNFRDIYGLEGIRLVATSTVRPEASELFDRRLFYYRAPLSSSKILSGGFDPLPCADPLVANAGCAAVAYLGFQDIYLFGVDCGRHFEGEHHSRDAVYYQDGYEIDPNHRPQDGFERVVPGNFGGKVLTTWSLDLSRRTFTALIDSRGMTLTNCSDGARIDGSRPKVAAAIDITHPPHQQEAVLKSVEEGLPFFEPGGLLTKIDLAAEVDACDAFERAFNELIDEALVEDEGFWSFEKRIEQFWYGDWAERKGVLHIIGGSFASLVRLGAYAGTRVRRPRTRRDFFRRFLEYYRTTCLWMASETRIMLQEMADGKAELSDVGTNPPFQPDADAPAEGPEAVTSEC